MPDTTPNQPTGNQHRRDAYDKANTYILAATLIAAGCAAGFTGWQAWIARDQEHRALRAYVVISAEMQTARDDGQPFIKITAENMGQTPVYNLTFNTWNSALQELEDVPISDLLAMDCHKTFSGNRLDNQGITFSKTTLKGSGISSPAETLKTWDEIFGKFQKVLTYGTVCYRDVFRDAHSVRVCFEWKSPNLEPWNCQREASDDQDY